MKKKLVFIGVGLLIAALVLFIISGYLLSNGFSKSVNMTGLKVKADNYTDLPITFNNSISAIAVYAVFTNATNLYLLNSTLFAKWNSYMSVNGSSVSGYQYAQKIGVNSTFLFKNVTVQVVPINLRAPEGKNFSGKLYVVLDNTKGSASSARAVNASVSFIPLSSSTVLVSAGLGYGVLILGIAAIIVIVWGLLKKDETQKITATTKNSPTAEQKKYLNQLYKGKGGKKSNN